jgi:hypothetical protein
VRGPTVKDPDRLNIGESSDFRGQSCVAAN